MTNLNKYARISGLLYLILILCGVFDLLFIPSRLIVWDDPAITLKNIRDSEWLFRLGVLAGILTFLSFLLLSLVLYKLLNRVNRDHALLMVMFVVVSIPLSFANMLNKFSILTLLGSTNVEVAADELPLRVMWYLEAFNNGVLLSQIFWGLWLFPFGYLVYKSRFLPRFLGIMLMIGCFGYLIEFTGQFLFPGYASTIIPTLVGLPATIGEFGICLWLLIAGVKEKKMAHSLALADPE